MNKPNLNTLLQILAKSRTYSGGSIAYRGASTIEIKEASIEIGMEFPADLQSWLTKVDGAEVIGCDFLGAKEIVKIASMIPEYRSASFLPIAGDSHGNHYVAVLGDNPLDPPIVFVEGILGRTNVCYIAASTLFIFIKNALERSLNYDDSLWPGDKDYVLREDPKIASFGYPLPWEA